MVLLKSFFTYYKFLGVLLILCIVSIFSTLFWSLDKGINLADEGLHYALSNPNTTNNNSLFNYDLFFKIFYKITKFEFGIISLRMLKFLLLVLLFILGLPIFNKNNFSVLDKLFLAIAIFCPYTFLTQSLSYNSICFILLLSYIYLYTNLQNSSVSKQNVLSFLMAILSSLCFFSKPPLSLLMFGITYILTFINLSKLRVVNLLVRCFLVTFGYVIVQFIFQHIFPDYSFIKVLNDGIQLSTYYESYNKFNLIKRLIVSFKWVFILSFIGLIIGYIFYKKKPSLLGIIISLIMIVVMLGYFFMSHLSSNEFNVFQYGLVIISAVALGFIMYFQKAKYFSMQKKILIVLLFIAPFICNLGSNVYFLRSGQQFIFFWFLLFVYLKNNSKTIPKYVSFVWYIIFSCFISIKIHNNVVVNPDNQPQLSSNFVTYNYGNESYIKIDKAQADYLINLKEKLNQYSPIRREIIGLYAMPGDILFTGYVNYYSPLIWDVFQFRFIKNMINENPKFKNTTMPLLVTRDFKNKEIEKIDGYRLLDSVKDYRNGYVYICDQF